MRTLPTTMGGGDFLRSPSATDTVRVRREFLGQLTDAVCYAASMAKVQLNGVIRSSHRSSIGGIITDRSVAHTQKGEQAWLQRTSLRRPAILRRFSHIGSPKT